MRPISRLKDGLPVLPLRHLLAEKTHWAARGSFVAATTGRSARAVPPRTRRCAGISRGSLQVTDGVRAKEFGRLYFMAAGFMHGLYGATTDTITGALPALMTILKPTKVTSESYREANNLWA